MTQRRLWIRSQSENEGGPAQVCRGDFGWAGQAGELLEGARGYTDATTIFGRCRVANQQIVGAARGRSTGYSSSEVIRGVVSDARALASISACSHCLRVRLFR